MNHDDFNRFRNEAEHAARIDDENLQVKLAEIVEAAKAPGKVLVLDPWACADEVKP